MLSLGIIAPAQGGAGVHAQPIGHVMPSMLDVCLDGGFWLLCPSLGVHLVWTRAIIL